MSCFLLGIFCNLAGRNNFQTNKSEVLKGRQHLICFFPCPYDLSSHDPAEVGAREGRSVGSGPKNQFYVKAQPLNLQLVFKITNVPEFSELSFLFANLKAE
jgi:hypothetical protein